MSDILNLNAALEYLDMGFSVIPVRKDKKPYIPWKEYQTRHPTEAELEAWFTKWPDANVAIVTGAISNIFAVDADSPIGVQYINNNCPTTGVYSITSPGHLHAIYKIPAGVTIKNGVRIAQDVDIRGDGGYIVAPPSIHEAGHAYQWQFVMDGWEDLAEYDPKLNGNKPSRAGIDLSNVKVILQIEPKPKGERNNALAQLAGRWYGKGLDDEEILLLAKSWNQTNQPPLPEKEILRTITSIKKTDTSNHPEKYIDTNQEPEKDVSDEIPAEILSPGGLLQNIMTHIDDNSPVSVPIFNLAAALSLLGNVAGQKVQTETGLRTNLYTVSIGYSGSGKNAPFEAIPQILLQSDAFRTLGPTELTSGAAMWKWLSVPEQRVCLTMIDEIGLVLKGLKNPHSACVDIPKVFIKLFSATKRPESKTYANGDTIIIPWSHFSFYGASTPERFYESLTPGEVTDGFLARILIFESRHDAPLPKTSMTFNSSPSIIEAINKICSIQVKTLGGNLENMPVPKMIPKNKKAQSYFNEWMLQYHNLRNETRSDGRGLSAIYGRAAEHAHKIAVGHATSLYLDKVRIVEIESVKWACRTVDYVVDNMIRQIKENIVDNETQRIKQKMINGVRVIAKKSKTGGATIREIQRGPGKGMLVKELKNILDSLLLSENLGKKNIKAKNGKDIELFYVSLGNMG